MFECPQREQAIEQIIINFDRIPRKIQLPNPQLTQIRQHLDHITMKWKLLKIVKFLKQPHTQSQIPNISI